MLEMNFKNDWKDYLQRKVQEFGYLYDESLNLKTNTIRYFSALRKFAPRERKTYQSKTLTVSPAIRSGFNEIVRRLENGEEIKPYLSRNTKVFSRNDLLLNDWGISHFHLGSCMEPDGYIKRTDFLLYAMLTEDSAFLLRISGHGHWTNTELIQILHDNWPHVLQAQKTGFSPKHLTVEARKALRKHHSNSTVTVSDGTSYLPLGGGITLSGDCIFDILKTDQVFAEIEDLEEIVIDNKDNLFEAAKIDKNEALTIRLAFASEEWYLFEPEKGIRFDIFRQPTSSSH